MAALLLAPPLLAACTITSDPVQGETVTTGSSAARSTAGVTSSPPEGATATRPVPAPTPQDPGPAAAALALAPVDTAYLTVTDWSAIKERLGAGGLTSESLQTDTLEFWRSVGSSTVLLTDGALRGENSRLRLRHGLTQDDVLWEVRWAGESGGEGDGLALRLRDDLDLAGLRRAVAEEVPGVAGAEVVAGDQLLLRGAAGPEGALAASEPMAALLDGEAAESRLAAPGCLSWPTALGVDADVEEQEAVVAGAAVEDLLEPQAWGMSFTGRSATLTVVHGEGLEQEAVEADAAARVALAEGWPTTEGVGWVDAFGLPPGLAEGSDAGYVVAEQGGRVVTTIDYRVLNPTAAAGVALAGLVPGAVCAEVDWLAEPTGL